MRCRLLSNQRASSTLSHHLWICTAYRKPRWCLSTTCTAARVAPSSSPELQWTVCRKLFRTTRCAPSRIPQPWRCSCRISATSATCRCAEKACADGSACRLTLPRVASRRAGEPLLLGRAVRAVLAQHLQPRRRAGQGARVHVQARHRSRILRPPGEIAISAASTPLQFSPAPSHRLHFPAGQDSADLAAMRAQHPFCGLEVQCAPANTNHRMAPRPAQSSRHAGRR